MNLTVVSIDKGYVRTAAEGRLTSDTLQPPGGGEPMEKLLGVTWAGNKVLLDMSRVSYLDSAAIGWLINCNKMFREAGGMLVLHSVPAGVTQIFSLLNIGRVLTIVPDESAAREKANGGAP
jgi:anti-anti-sigma factor